MPQDKPQNNKHSLGRKPPDCEACLIEGNCSCHRLTKHLRTALLEASEELESECKFAPNCNTAREKDLILLSKERCQGCKLAKKMRISAGVE